MLILADEDVDAPLVRWLREQGHDVSWVAESSAGSSDEGVLARAVVDGRVLITADLDFGEMTHRRSMNSVGIVLLRMFQRGWSVVAARAAGSFCVISPGRVRIRPLPPQTKRGPP